MGAEVKLPVRIIENGAVDTARYSMSGFERALEFFSADPSHLEISNRLVAKKLVDVDIADVKAARDAFIDLKNSPGFEVPKFGNGNTVDTSNNAVDLSNGSLPPVTEDASEQSSSSPDLVIDLDEDVSNSPLVLGDESKLSPISRFLKEISHNLLTREEEFLLALNCRLGALAKESLVLANPKCRKKLIDNSSPRGTRIVACLYDHLPKGKESSSLIESMPKDGKSDEYKEWREEALSWLIGKRRIVVRGIHREVLKAYDRADLPVPTVLRPSSVGETVGAFAQFDLENAMTLMKQKFGLVSNTSKYREHEAWPWYPITVSEISDQAKEGKFGEELKQQIIQIDLAFEESHDLLARHNIRLAISEAKRYWSRGLKSQEKFLDLCMLATQGMLKAIPKYQPECGFQFSTYATTWIKQVLRRDSGTEQIHIPEYIKRDVQLVRRLERQTLRELGQQVSDAEMYERVLVKFADEKGMSPAKARFHLDLACQARASVRSLDQIVDDHKNTTLGDFIEDSSTPEASEAAALSELQQIIHNVVDSLPTREALIIRERFGINEEREARTLEEVGALTGLTRERVRQIENKALRRLKLGERWREILGGQDFIESEILGYVENPLEEVALAEGKKKRRRIIH